MRLGVGVKNGKLFENREAGTSYRMYFRSRSTQRLTGVHRATIMRFMVRAGNGSKKLMDEVRVYVGKKQKHVTENENEYPLCSLSQDLKNYTLSCGGR